MSQQPASESSFPEEAKVYADSWRPEDKAMESAEVEFLEHHHPNDEEKAKAAKGKRACDQS